MIWGDAHIKKNKAKLKEIKERNQRNRRWLKEEVWINC